MERKLFEDKRDQPSVEFFGMPAIVETLKTDRDIDEDIVPNKRWQDDAVHAEKKDVVNVQMDPKLRKPLVKDHLKFWTSQTMFNIIVGIMATKEGIMANHCRKLPEVLLKMQRLEEEPQPYS